MITSGHSETWTFFEGEWHAGNVALMGPRTHAAWLGSTVFDGARAFEGVTPDLVAHLERVNRSAALFGLKPVVTVEMWQGLVADGLARFAPGAELYIRPMYWAENGYGGGVMFDPDSTNWCLSLYIAPMPARDTGNTITLSPYRRPTLECAQVEVKAGCLYPNGARALAEAKTRGFGNCLMRDMLGNIAELANSNLFFVRDGVVFTPAANGTFLAGITRARVIDLMRGDGIEVRETTLTYADVLKADEIFCSGNYAKVAPILGIEERALKPGPMYWRARDLYWQFAHSRAG